MFNPLTSLSAKANRIGARLGVLLPPPPPEYPFCRASGAAG